MSYAAREGYSTAYGHETASRRSVRLALVLPVAKSARLLEKMKADYLAEALGVATSFSFADGAPEAIESPEDAVAAEQGVVRAAVQAVEAGADAVLVTCFSDPGVQASSRAVDVPVMGEGRPTIAAVGALFERFSILSSQSTTVDSKTRMVAELGLASRLKSVVGLDIPVCDLTCDRAEQIAEIVAVEASEGAQAVVLGCTGFEPGFTLAVRRALGGAGNNVAVIDPAEIAGRAIVAAALSAGPHP